MAPNIAVVLTNAEKRIIWVNEDFTQMTGYTLLDAMGKSPGHLLQGPGTEPEAVAAIRQGLNSKAPFQERITNYRKNGEPYTCVLTVHPILDEAQEPVNFIAFEVDGSKVEAGTPLPLLDLKEKYSSSSLKGADELRLFAYLQRFMDSKQPFLRADFSLQQAADALRTNTKYLSQVINYHAGCNFRQFVNQYRVEEVKRKIREDREERFTLAGIAEQCGFRNKSTFHNAFKKHEGSTPHDFLKKVRAERETLPDSRT